MLGECFLFFFLEASILLSLGCIDRHDLLDHDISAVSHRDRGFAVFVALDAVDVGADPVRHVCGIGAECWCEGRRMLE